jgi:hypothetical protein
MAGHLLRKEAFVNLWQIRNEAMEQLAAFVTKKELYS